MFAISTDPAEITIPVGKNGQMSLILENASTGLSGYNLTLTISDPSVAHISGISIPDWAGMKDTTALPAASCTVRAIDLDDLILPGMEGIIMLNVSVTGLSPGNCSLSALLNQVDDDQGNLITTSFPERMITIRPLHLPVANFSADPRSGYEPLSVNFTDQSGVNTTEWGWDFGDGSYSTEQNPSHLFKSPGNYSVTLTVTNEDGTSQAIYPEYIRVLPSNAGIISISAEGPLLYTWGDPVHFSGINTESTATCLMVTGPGLSETGCRLQNLSSSVATGDLATFDTAPVRPDLTWEYRWNTSEITGGPVSPGIYTVFALSAPCNLTDLSGCLYDDLNITLSLPGPDILSANFTGNITEGYAPFTVGFTDLSTGDPVAWEWDFGDGSPSVGEKNPVHGYITPGLYPVSLNVSTATNSSHRTRDDYIQVHSPPGEPMEANFTIDITSGAVPLDVRFTDISMGNITSWVWDFGDGRSSDEQNPLHRYTEPGVYSVTLTVGTAGDSDTISGQEAVKVYASFYSLTLQPPGITIEGTSPRKFILEKAVFQGTVTLGDGTVTATGMGGDFTEGTFSVDDLAENDTVLSGRITSAVLTSRPLLSTIAPYGDLAPRISIGLAAIPVSRNLTVGLLPGAYLTDRMVYEVAARNSGKRLQDIYYTMEIDASEIEEDVLQGAVIMPVPRAITGSQGRSTIGIFRNTGTGCSLLDTTIEAVGSDRVVFRGISPGGFSVFAIGSVSSPQYSVSSGGGGGGGGGSPAAAPQSQNQPVVQEEPPVPDASPVQVQEEEELSDFQPPGVSEPGITPLEQPDSYPADQTFPDAAGEESGQTSAPDYAQSARSEMESGHYLQAAADCMRAAGGERKPCSPVAASLPADACPVCAVAAGLGIAALGAALSPGGYGSRSGRTGRSKIPQRNGMPEQTFLQNVHRLEKLKESFEEMSRLKTLSWIGQWEKKLRPIIPAEQEAVLFRFTLQEVLISGISVVLFGIAFLVAGQLQAQLQALLAFILAGAVALVAHELITIHYARKYGFASELRFWGLGSAILLATAGLFGVVFGKPSQTLFEGKEAPDPREKAVVLLSGPALNIVIAVASLMMIPAGGFLTLVGITGFSINLLLSVYTLSPIPQMKGRALYDWNRGYWAAIYLPLIIFFVVVYLAI